MHRSRAAKPALVVLLSLSAQYTEAITHPVTHPRSIDDTTKAQEVPEMASFSRRHRVASRAAPLVAGPNSEGRLDHLIKFKREGGKSVVRDISCVKRASNLT